ncbi:MAG TPA: PEP-CTERM sorting domain-containing protein [Tepidisphaeraceae bacterium]|jgi:hypothetical protein|nr:PEP-CTERM sorting domain-containing protein [Tepidisphaeraceae bacterium]
MAAAAAVALEMLPLPQAARADLVIWTNGSANGLWDNTSANWNDLTNPPTTTYADGDQVQFSGSSPGGSLAIGNVTGATPNGVSPASVEFTTGSDSYTFTDATGDTLGIQGAIPLTLDSDYTGTVYLSGQDSITGTATVNGGTLQLTGSGASTLGTGNIVLNGGNVAFQHSLTAFANNITADQATSGLVSNSSGDNVVFVGTLSSTVGATTSNTVLNFSGGSTDSVAPLTATNNWAGFTGTLNWGSTAQVLRLQAIGAGDTVGSSTALFNLGTGTGTLEMENATGVVLLGALEGGATTTLAGATHSGSNTNSYGEFVIGGAGLDTTFNGIITQGAERGSIEVTGGGSLTLTNASTYSTKTGSAPNYIGAGTTILGNGQEPVAGVLYSYLTANASNGGGKLYVSNTTGSATGSSPVYVEGASSATNNGNGISGGTLGGDGIIQGEVSTVANSVNEAGDSAPVLANFAAGAHIAPGAVGSNTLPVLTLSGGLDVGDYTNLDFSLDALPTDTDNSMIAVSNTTSGNGQVANALTLPGDGNVEVNFSWLNSSSPELGVAYDLISYTGTDLYIGGTPASLDWTAVGVPAGDTVTFGDTGQGIGSNPNYITATFNAVPEPASISLIGLGSVFLLRRRRQTHQSA